MNNENNTDKIVMVKIKKSRKLNTPIDETFKRIKMEQAKGGV